VRSARLLALLLAIGCSHSDPARNLDLDAIRVSGDARMRTDVLGSGAFADKATFVLVDAENTAGEGAYVTLGGALTDAGGATVGTLKAQSLWIPAHDQRTFALVDDQREARPAATAARVAVKGALVPSSPDGAPRAHIEELHAFDDYGKTVVQAYLVNDADRLGSIMVIASFHDAQNRPMTRPFEMMPIDGKSKRTVQFVGPPGSVRGTIYVGDVIY
jgi:hypothetical protein